MVIEINLLSLNSEGAFRTIIQRRMPHNKIISSTVKDHLYNPFMNTLCLTDSKRMVPPITFTQKRLQIIGCSTNNN